MIRVLVAEDMRILRDMLVSMLNLEDDIKVVAQVADGTGVVPAALAEHPDLAVLDIDMPEVDGLTAAAELHEQLRAQRQLGLDLEAALEREEIVVHYQPVVRLENGEQRRQQR